MEQKIAIIIGAGPAGLTAAYELLHRTDIRPVVYEMTNDVGGISKTVNYKGNRIDIGGKDGEARCEISKLLTNYELISISAIHPTSYVSKTSIIGIGSQIMMRATVAARVQIGDYSLLNTGCIVEHECWLGNGVHIGPGVTLAGLVKIGHFSFIGAGSVVLPNVHIGANSIIGAGSVISVVANAFPAAFSAMVRLMEKKQYDKALAVHYSLLDIIEQLFADGNPAGVKAALSIMDVCKNYLRLPLVSVNKTVLAELKRLIINYNTPL